MSPLKLDDYLFLLTSGKGSQRLTGNQLIFWKDSTDQRNLPLLDCSSAEETNELNAICLKNYHFSSFFHNFNLQYAINSLGGGSRDPWRNSLARAGAGGYPQSLLAAANERFKGRQLLDYEVRLGKRSTSKQRLRSYAS